MGRGRDRCSGDGGSHMSSTGGGSGGGSRGGGALSVGNGCTAGGGSEHFGGGGISGGSLFGGGRGAGGGDIFNSRAGAARGGEVEGLTGRDAGREACGGGTGSGWSEASLSEGSAASHSSRNRGTVCIGVDRGESFGLEQGNGFGNVHSVPDPNYCCDLQCWAPPHLVDDNCSPPLRTKKLKK